VSEFIIDLFQPVKIQKKNRERLLVSFGQAQDVSERESEIPGD